MSRIRQLLKSALAAALPKSWLLAHGPHRPSAIAEIALTFDDGPHAEHTPRLLDLLADAGAKGTFFVIGERAEMYPDILRRIADEGHELGNHTWTHSEPSQTTTAKFLDEIDRTRQLIQQLTGRDCRLTRPPKGSLTFGKAMGLWQQRQSVALWNVDPKDFAMHDDSEMSEWVDQYAPQTGDIVLLHEDYPHTVTALREMIRDLKRRGLSFTTVNTFTGRP